VAQVGVEGVEEEGITEQREEGTEEGPRRHVAKEVAEVGDACRRHETGEAGEHEHQHEVEECGVGAPVEEAELPREVERDEHARRE